MSYEVVELKLASPVQTVFTSESYDEAFDVWKKLFYENGHGRMDLVGTKDRCTSVSDGCVGDGDGWSTW